MGNRDLGKRIGSFALTVVTAVSTSVFILHSYNKIKFKYVKPTEEVIKECNDLNLDYSYLKNQNNNCTLLNITPEESILVKYDSSLSKKEVEIINDVVDYYDDVFKTIDSKYDFELISSDDKKSRDAIISIGNRKNDDIENDWTSTYGMNQTTYRYTLEKMLYLRVIFI